MVSSCFRVRREITVVLDERQRPEPDVFVVHASSAVAVTQSGYPGKDVELVVEVVSRESLIRDRERKPQLYARAGIPNFWRVEFDHGQPVVYAYERDPASGDYVATGIHRGTLSLTDPFPIDIDLTGMDTE